MKQQILTFNNFNDVILQEEKFVVPEGYRKLQVGYSMISPGTELFCIQEAIKAGTSVQPGYILTGMDESGQHYFLFPSLAESSACHCNVRAVGPESLMLPLPSEIPLTESGFLRFINIGMHAFNQLDKLPESVCVIGLGPVGNLAAQTAKLLGCHVTGVDPSTNRCKIANECSIAVAIPPEELEKQHKTFDLVIDTVMASSTLKTSAAILRDGGECSMIGIVKDSELKASDIFREIWQRKLVFRSGWEMLNSVKKLSDSILVSSEENLNRALNWMKNGGYSLKPLLTGIIPADEEQIRKAYIALKDNPDENMCYLIEWSGTGGLDQSSKLFEKCTQTSTKQ
jgi:threonine dehydrogenase-like Zn-dependent dehydrogenase